MDLFSTLARCGTGNHHFDPDAALWDEMIARGAKVSPTEATCEPGSVREMAWLDVGKATLYMTRTRKMTLSEHRARREALAREEEQLAAEPPVNHVAEDREMDRERGL